ncbi:MAG: hypothetical protein K2W82_13565 [Candidatus Obscuribacterales bacterium]|nr:hypothetical protein [Candidatus Obscuribacterales bacterium]
MQSSNPTLKKLKSIQKKLLQKIEEAKSMFPAEKSGPELLTGQAALKGIEELIKNAQGEAA